MSCLSQDKNASPTAWCRASGEKMCEVCSWNSSSIWGGGLKKIDQYWKVKGHEISRNAKKAEVRRRQTGEGTTKNMIQICNSVQNKLTTFCLNSCRLVQDRENSESSEASEDSSGEEESEEEETKAPNDLLLEVRDDAQQIEFYSENADLLKNEHVVSKAASTCIDCEKNLL